MTRGLRGLLLLLSGFLTLLALYFRHLRQFMLFLALLFASITLTFMAFAP